MAPHLDSLFALLLPHLPVLLLASNTLKTADAHSELMPLANALRMQWCSFNSESHANAITIDVDHAEWLEMLVRMAMYRCPPPNLVVTDPWTGRAHVTWKLRDPVRTGEADRDKPRNLLRLVQQGLTRMLKGDLAYTGRLTKNPWATGRPSVQGKTPAIPAIWDAYQASRTKLRYHTITPNPEPVSLYSLRGAVVAFAEDEGLDTATWFPWKHGKASAESESMPGRQLFDQSRWRVYRLHRSDPAAAKDSDVVLTIVQEEAERLGSPATPGQMRGIARSITKFMRTQYGRRAAKKPAVVKVAKVGPMGLDPSLPLAIKQRMAARHAATLRTARTSERVINAAADLIQEGILPTRSLIVSRTGLHRTTVAAHWQANPGGVSVSVYRPSVSRAEVTPSLCPALPEARLPPVPTQPIQPPAFPVQEPDEPTVVQPPNSAKIPAFLLQRTNPPPESQPPNLIDADHIHSQPIEPPLSEDENRAATKWLDQLSGGPIPQSGTIPYSLATRMWAHGLMEPHRMVRRDDKGIVIDRIPQWRLH